MFVTADRTWMDPSSSWWAKANRANEHLDSLRRQVEEFRASDPYSLTPEPTDKPGRLAHRLRFSKPVPVTISATIGDVLHNLRAALENLAFEMACRSQSQPLTPGQERASAFPICESPADFQAFFTAKTARNDGLYDSRARAAFQAVQPFVNLGQAHDLGVALDRTFAEDFLWSKLHRLDALWNVDKHRRLTLMAWWPNLIYWGSDGPSNRNAFPGDGTLADGSILLYTEGADEGQSDELQHQFNLVLTDDPAHTGTGAGATTDVLDLLAGFHQHIVGLVVLPRIFALMSQPP